ncbi:CDP-alcohol phosphatidyltransferase family protein [Defluviitalea raffinosedens]|uniref:CDP-alcohol phosphatidyltransferase family protein n=1 Tax=Defluviitalea raffinosedens TaxID=1450156 RepID=UPI00195B87A4|nr:CDP-alcohol phosphatidyltransferase family protein [Defluviitalea raffinosedens]MBM7686985.1 CDP-diacylglycerol--glycerol-3-phosphate 3-phosphatidyltransferase [Defluviitalea raffinosedens]
MANIITSVRILCSIALLFCTALSPTFYILYLLAGVTDMVDGIVARKTNTVSEFGSKLDTIADFVFVVVCLIKLIPALDIPVWLYLWIGAIVAIKVINLVSGFIVQKKFVEEHTIMNKVTGLMLFILLLTLSIVDLKYSAIIVCTVATFAAIEEGRFIRSGTITDDLPIKEWC